MDIFINQGEYTSLTDEAGVRVVLTDQSRMPFPFDEGFSVPTGFSTSVGVKKVMFPTRTSLCIAPTIYMTLLELFSDE